MPELTVVMPAYNEEEALAGVVTAWLRALDAADVDYQLRLYDDGSRDQTLRIARDLASREARLKVIGQENRGHGPTLLRGYHEAASPWIFQTDSDGEIGTERFVELWRQRHEHDFLIGSRQGRQAPPVRRAMTAVAHWMTRGFQLRLQGERIQDTNIPFRLMRRERLLPLLSYVPPQTFAPNVALSGLAIAEGLRIFQLPVPSQERAGGVPSLRQLNLLRAAVRSWRETAAIAWRYRRSAP
ncbi:MAG: glycosyltransferase family 2 protein [Acidobacteriota bacterium]